MKETILQEPNPILRKKSIAADQALFQSLRLNTLLEQMKNALSLENNGVAIAAPQVGELLQIFVVAGRVFRDEHHEKEKLVDKVFINPSIVRHSRRKSPMSEGCLSVKGVFGSVERYEKMTIKACDENGKEFIYHGSGLLAQIFQHEIDHLHGTLFIDKMINQDTASQ